MAKDKIKYKSSQHSSSNDTGPQGIMLFYATLIFVVAAVISLLIKQSSIFSLSPSDWPTTEKAEEDDPQVQMLYDDLDIAQQTFSKDGFDNEQIFGSKPFWGSLNSGHYFGLKLSTPRSIETSLMWFKNQLNSDGRLNIRHLCDQNDNLKSYGWTHHDFWTFGRQTIEDNDYKLTTSYIKDSKDSLSWQAKIDIELNASQNPNLKPISIIQYITTNHPDDTLTLVGSPSSFQSRNGLHPFTISGNSVDLGGFSLEIKLESQDRNFQTSYLVDHFDKSRLPVSIFLHSKMVVSTQNKTRVFLLPGKMNQSQRPNIIAFQILLKKSASLTINFTQSDESVVFTDTFEARMKNKIAEFEKQFDNEFGTFGQAEVDKKLARVSLSNLLGGVGYFYGYSYIGSSLRQDKVVPYGPMQLLTAVPSRSFFPRGFLWDEGFHNLLISRWDANLSNMIIKSWFNIMNRNGWIPREVILGVESMRRVPNEFIVQRIANANPPAMLLVIESMLYAGTLSEQLLDELYPKLKQWYAWFNGTQFGPRRATFRWRGRDELAVNMLNPKTLTSGLDDYPRASHPSPNEFHIDLRCWMALASRTIAKVAAMVGDDGYQQTMSSIASELSDNLLLDEQHWSEQYEMYCDYGLNTENAELAWVVKTRKSQQHEGGYETYKALERLSTGHPIMGCVPEFGYVSLFPMIMKILDTNSAKLGVILRRLRDKDELWTPYGIRSLSKSSKYYRKFNTEHDKPYWRGPIWLNLNYLILSSLNHYSKQEGPYKEQCSVIAAELKRNLIDNVSREFERTNYLWENYDDLTGQGQGSHPFTGWSSLILLIMSN